LFNLLGNAVKFTSTDNTHQGQISLRVEPSILNDGLAGLRIRVKDNGIGMSKETVDALFQPFSQADESTTRRFGGTGLGLSITKRLVDMLHGGKFQASCRLNVKNLCGNFVRDSNLLG
jgi:signal transduction histidine kinase